MKIITNGLKITWGSSDLCLTEADCSSKITILELKVKLQSRTQLLADRMKLIYRGKLLEDDITIHFEENEKKSVRLVLIGTANALPEGIIPSDPLLRNDLTSSSLYSPSSRKYKVSLNSLNKREQCKSLLQTPYRFHALITLPNLPDQTRALSILTQLSQDPGILAVLRKHQWSVGSLEEMYPEGFVGVSGVCVLGLNQNKGQRILLRLRTDALEGFRNMLTIKKVLCHELAHNEHSEHNDSFYRLMRVIERESNEFDWRNSSSKQISSSAFYRREDDDDRESLPASDSSTGGRRLGGAEGFRAIDMCHSCQSQLVKTAVQQKPLEDRSLATEDKVLCTNEVKTNDISTEKSSSKKEDIQTLETSLTSLDKANSSSYPTLPPLSDILTSELISNLIRGIDNCIAHMYEMADDSILSKCHQLRESLVAPIQSFSRSTSFSSRLGLVESLSSLRNILAKAKDSSEEKHRCIRKRNKIFRRYSYLFSALPSAN